MASIFFIFFFNLIWDSSYQDSHVTSLDLKNYCAVNKVDANIDSSTTEAIDFNAMDISVLNSAANFNLN